MKIILVDDAKDLSELVKTVLTREGYEVDIFHTAEEGLSAARNHPPGLIIMDEMLPGLSGAEAVKKMQKDDDLKTVSVMFLTGLIPSSGRANEETVINVGGQEYKALGKPFEIETLLDIVKSFRK